MRCPIRLLKRENFPLKLRLENLSFGLTLKVCILFSVMSISLACWGGGGGGGGDDDDQHDFNSTFVHLNETISIPELDEKFVANLTGITDPVEKVIKTAWQGWEPDEQTKEDWKKWYNEYQACKEKHEGSDGKKKKKKKKGKVEEETPVPKDCTKYGFAPEGQGPGGWGSPGGGGPGGGAGSGGPGGSDYNYEDRGPGSGWPNSPEWQGLGAGSAGVPIPPWAWRPINIGKPSFCYLSPVRGKCKSELTRWGYNPYKDECQSYIYGGCGGTRNRFTTKEICEKHCMQPIPPSCSADSGIIETNLKLPDK